MSKPTKKTPASSTGITSSEAHGTKDGNKPLSLPSREVNHHKNNPAARRQLELEKWLQGVEQKILPPKSVLTERERKEVQKSKNKDQTLRHILEKKALMEMFSAAEDRLETDPVLKLLTPYEKCLHLSKGLLRQVHDIAAFEEQAMEVKWLVQEIDSSITKGHINALRRLALLAHESTNLLTRWAKDYPDYVKIVAQDYSTWPLLCSKSGTQRKELIQILNLIGLDSNLPKGALHSKVGDLPQGAKLWAADLLKRLELTRRRAVGKKSINSPILWSITKEPNNWELTDKYPEIAAAAEKLPALKDETSGKWWMLAQKLFLAMTSDKPWTVDGLKDYAKSATYDTDGSKRAAVIKQVRQAFKCLAAASIEEAPDR